MKKLKYYNLNIIICNKEENTQEIVETCEKITLVYVSNIHTLEDNFSFIKDIGDIFNIRFKAKILIDNIQSELSNFQLHISKKSQRNVAYFIWRNPWMVAGNTTFINELLKLNRFKNVFQNYERYPEINLEQLKTLDLGFILLSSEPYPFKEKHLKEIQQYTSAKILLVDGEYFSWYGSRLLKAFRYFKSLH